jgi:hypothetical protein
MVYVLPACIFEQKIHFLTFHLQFFLFFIPVFCLFYRLTKITKIRFWPVMGVFSGHLIIGEEIKYRGDNLLSMFVARLSVRYMLAH